jgi:hypothetical protein
MAVQSPITATTRPFRKTSSASTADNVDRSRQQRPHRVSRLANDVGV